MAKYYTLKLTNGDELIGEYLPAPESYTMKNTHVLRFIQHPKTGETVPMFSQYLNLASPNEAIRINPDHVLVYPVTVDEDVERAFISFTTGVEVPPTPKILMG